MPPTRLAVTPQFMTALTELSKGDQPRVIATIRKFNAAQQAAGLRAHHLDGLSNGFVSYSAGLDIRLIGIPYQDYVALVHVDHHDRAYDWAERHVHMNLEPCGALEIIPAAFATGKRGEPSTVAHVLHAKATYGSEIAERLTTLDLPAALLDRVSQIEDEAGLWQLVDALSPGLQEIIIAAAADSDLSTYSTQRLAPNVTVLNTDEELERAVTSPLATWRLFLHSTQREIVEAPKESRMVVMGGPGTGKTVALLHRAVHLAKTSSPIVLVTLSFELAKDILTLLNSLASSEGILVGSFIRRKNAPADAVFDRDQLSWLTRKARPPYGFKVYSEGAVPVASTGVGHILVDESQDLAPEMQQWITDLLNRSSVGITLAIDVNQMVRTWGGEPLPLLKRLDAADIRKVSLSYNYRLTRETLGYGQRVLSMKESGSREAPLGGNRLDVQLPAIVRYASPLQIYGLSGVPVKEVACDEGRIMEVIRKVTQDLRVRYEAHNLAILVPDEQDLDGESFLDVKVLSFHAAKGMEWFAGVVVVDDSFIQDVESSDGLSPYPKGMKDLNQLISFNRMYVAITRFRDRVVVVRVRNATKFSMRSSPCSAREYTNAELRDIFARKNGVTVLDYRKKR